MGWMMKTDAPAASLLRSRLGAPRLAAALVTLALVVSACTSDPSTPSSSSPQNASTVASQSSGAITGKGSVSAGNVHVKVPDKALPIKVTTPALTAENFEEIHGWMQAGAIVGHPVDITVTGSLPDTGTQISREYASPLPEDVTATLAFYNEEYQTWEAVPTSISPDRRTITADVDHLSLWTDFVHGSTTGLATFRDGLAQAGKTVVSVGATGLKKVNAAIQHGVGVAAEETYYLVGKTVSTRVNPPTCEGKPPAWAETVVHIKQDKNNPVHWCAGRDPAKPNVLVVKARVNRGFSFGYSTAVKPLWAKNEAYNTQDFDAALDVLANLDSTIATSVAQISHQGRMVGPGQELSFGFTEKQVRALDTGEELVVLHVPNLASFLAGFVAKVSTGLVVDATSGWITSMMLVASCSQELSGVTDERSAALALVGCIPDKDVMVAKQVAPVFDKFGWKTTKPGDTPGKYAGKVVRKVGLVLALIEPMDYTAAKNMLSSVRTLTVYTTTNNDDAAAQSGNPHIVLEEAGHLKVDGVDVSELPYKEGLAKLTQVLGEPEETGPDGGACETHLMPGYAVKWTNLRILVQTGDNVINPGLNDRKGRIVGWELFPREGIADTNPNPLPTFSNGLGLGSTLDEVRAEYSSSYDGPGDGNWMISVEQDGTYGVTDFNSGGSSNRNSNVGFIASGYACGS